MGSGASQPAWPMARVGSVAGVAFVHLVCGERSQGDMRAAKLCAEGGGEAEVGGFGFRGESQSEGKGRKGDGKGGRVTLSN